MIRPGTVIHHEQVCPTCHSRDIFLVDTEWLDQNKKIKTLNVLFLCAPCAFHFSQVFQYEREESAKKLLHELNKWCLDPKYINEVKQPGIQDITEWIQ